MHTYFGKHLFKPIRLGERPSDDVSLVVVIPCHNEPDILSTLDSLNNCEPARGSVEVIIVINSSEDASLETKSQNEKTFREIVSWQEKRKGLRLFVLRDEDLPRKHAGVGFARKIGMDEAAWRFECIGKKDGVIVCLDADCLVAPNYLKAIEKDFSDHPDQTAASIHFEHPLESLDENSRNGIINYELHLRYYIQGLKYAGYPFAYHTIGSSMCVRSDVYQRMGGINKRKAGEDFYFLHKIIPLGRFGNINTTTVYPSPRVSDRVPFGTGRAMKNWTEKRSEEFTTYDIRIFEDLKIIFQSVSDFYKITTGQMQKITQSLPDSIRSFIVTTNFMEKVYELNSNTASLKTFTQRFFNWMDGFKTLKTIHYLRDKYYPDSPIEVCAKELLLRLNGQGPADNKRDLLNLYRAMDKAR